MFYLNKIYKNIKIPEIGGRGHVKDFFQFLWIHQSLSHLFIFFEGKLTQTMFCLLFSCLHTLPSAGTIQNCSRAVNLLVITLFRVLGWCVLKDWGLRFEMYHALLAACFVRLSALYMLRRRDWMVEGWINEDKARAPLGVFLYSPLTQAERFPPCFTIQMLPRGTVTSRFGEREKERRNQKERVS